jgi:hypothetical protein
MLAESKCSYDVSMRESEDQQAFRAQAATLGEIGSVLARAELPDIEVRLPKDLARAAVEAWEWDDNGEPELETPDQEIRRHQAGTLALIGLAVSERGRNEGDEVVVRLSPDLIGPAIDAADDLPSPPRPE